MADLPPERLQVDKPSFSHAEIDYFVPLLITQKRSQFKQYGCMFTCPTVCAVHLEIFHSVTTDSFINALLRFIARQDAPDHNYSGNGTNFGGTTKILREWNQHQINDYLRQQEIQ